MNGAKNLI